SPSTKGRRPSKVAPSSLGAPLAVAPTSDTMAALKPCRWRSANHSRACGGDSLVIRAQGEAPPTRRGLADLAGKQPPMGGRRPGSGGRGGAARRRGGFAVLGGEVAAVGPPRGQDGRPRRCRVPPGG